MFYIQNQCGVIPGDHSGFRCGVIRGNRGCKLGKHGQTLVWTCEIPLVNGSGLVGHLYFE